jgi:DNA-binding NarL/FixJ family response regulator
MGVQARAARVLVVDISAPVRATLRAALDTGLEVVGEADSARQAVELVGALRPDAVVLQAHAWLAASRGPTDEGRVPLSGRQLAILRLVAEGLSNREIAALINLSQLTVKGYVEQILALLGARNRVQAAVLAIRRGLI